MALPTLIRPFPGLHPITGFPYDAGTHVYGYDGSNNLITDAWTFQGVTFTKTYTYTGNNLTGESEWV